MVISMPEQVEVLRISKYTLDYIKSMGVPTLRISGTYEDREVYNYEGAMYNAYDDFIKPMRSQGISVTLVDVNNNIWYYKLGQDGVIPKESVYAGGWYDPVYYLYVVVMSEDKLERLDEELYGIFKEYILTHNRKPTIKEFVEIAGKVFRGEI